MIPPTSSSSVSLEAPIFFQFDEPMQTGFSIAWSQNLFTTNFTYAWGPDGKVLACVYRIPLPENEAIQWTLNPSSRAAEFRDLSFNALPQAAGSFRTVALVPLTLVTTALPFGRRNQSFSATLEASGGLPPYTWSLAKFSEPLPEGLTLTAAGEIAGTSSIGGTKTLRVSVADRTGKSVEKSLSLEIKAHGTVEGPIQLRISTMSAERLRFDWNSAFGEAYQLQYKNRVDDAVWVPLNGNVIGTGTNSFTVQTFPAGPRFYRLMVVN